LFHHCIYSLQGVGDVWTDPQVLSPPALSHLCASKQVFSVLISSPPSARFIQRTKLKHLAPATAFPKASAGS
jgi:hypothetical protein